MTKTDHDNPTTIMDVESATIAALRYHYYQCEMHAEYGDGPDSPEFHAHDESVRQLRRVLDAFYGPEDAAAVAAGAHKQAMRRAFGS